MLILIAYLIRYIMINFPKVIISKSGISFSTYFKKTFYAWDEIESIRITGKEYFKILFRSIPMEATTLYLKNGKCEYIWSDSYLNISEIRTVLARAEKLLSENNNKMNLLDFEIGRSQRELNDINLQDKIKFNGNQLRSANGLIFYGFIFFSLSAFFKNPSSKMTDHYGAIIFLLLVGSIICWILSVTMHYFVITEKYIIVKNNVWFWWSKVYEIENIKEIVLEMPLRQSTSLRIITKDFHSKTYQASSLRDKTWVELKACLLAKGIEVRNETPY